MSYKINVILVKAGYCIHCKHFTPIYEIAKDLINSNKEYNKILKDANITSFTVDDPIEKSKLLNTFPGLFEETKGYPTVYLIVTGGNSVKTHMIDHTIRKGDSEEDLKEAAVEFIENLINKYKTIISDGKEEYKTVQRGGHLDYKNKYLKYKTKYLELKKKL